MAHVPRKSAQSVFVSALRGQIQIKIIMVLMEYQCIPKPNHDIYEKGSVNSIFDLFFCQCQIFKYETMALDIKHSLFPCDSVIGKKIKCSQINFGTVGTRLCPLSLKF